MGAGGSSVWALISQPSTYRGRPSGSIDSYHLDDGENAGRFRDYLPRSQEIWLPLPILVMASCVTLGNILNLSE